jgi:hypothetical protein
MCITAHHVVSSNQRQGVNAFLYRHETLSGDEAPPVEITPLHNQNPGTLVAQSISVAPPGNRVRSYLDIVAPDDTPWNEIRTELMAFVGRMQPSALPWSGPSGRCHFGLGMDRELSHQWQRELAILYRAAQALRLAHSD